MDLGRVSRSDQLPLYYCTARADAAAVIPDVLVMEPARPGGGAKT